MSEFNTIAKADFESFDDKVNENCNKYNTRKKAYEKTEKEHSKTYGHRRFRCYQTYKSTKHWYFYKKKKHRG